VDLSALATRIAAELRRTEPERQVRIDIEPGLQVQGDARMLEAVMRNLLGNAWKYTGRAADAQIRLSQRFEGDDRWICVADNGAGFDMAHAGRLFKPFARLHRQDEFSGLGIGLATVQRIIERHGGRIQAHSRPHQGATFEFTLPATRAGGPHQEDS
jgi:signal transduction histidine kinase